MTDLERRKTEVEVMRVKTARMELELRIEEMKADIVRLTDNIKIQVKREEELAIKLAAK